MKKNWSWVIIAGIVLIILNMNFLKNEVLGGITLILVFIATLIIQLKSGYTLNRQWSEDISREERPNYYWSMITVNIIFLLFFICLTLSFYFHPNLNVKH